MLLAFFWGIKLFCSSKFEILMLFDLNNLSFYHCHSRASSIKNIPHLGLFLLSMAKWISKYIARDKFWTLWGYFGYFCSLKHLWDKLTHPCLITSFQTLPEIGLRGQNLPLEYCQPLEMQMYSKMEFRSFNASNIEYVSQRVAKLLAYSSLEWEKTVNKFPLWLWICFRDFMWLLSWPDEKFCPESTQTRWLCNYFSKMWPKSKSEATLV